MRVIGAVTRVSERSEDPDPASLPDEGIVSAPRLLTIDCHG